jgi:hypothetical protein
MPVVVRILLNFRRFRFHFLLKIISSNMPCCCVPFCRSGYPETLARNRELGVPNPHFFSMPRVSCTVLFAACPVLLFINAHCNVYYCTFVSEQHGCSL